MTFQGKHRLPICGVGLSFRPEIAASIYQSLDALDFVEVIIDNVINGSVDERFSEQIVERMPTVGHGVNSSLGSLEPLDRNYLARVRRFTQQLQCRWFSDHLAFTQSEDMDIGQLMPVQFVSSNIAWIASKIREAQHLIGLPFLLENITYYFTIPGAEMDEVDFLLRLLAEARCGLLLDVNNLHANALNHGYDPYAFIDRLPDYAVATKQPNAILLEREKNFPPMETLVAELEDIRRIWLRHRGRRPCHR
jgi:uncharacterized protein (UPF0276 family)